MIKRNICLITLLIFSSPTWANHTEHFECLGPIVRGQVKATAQLEYLTFPTFKLKMHFDNGSTSALIEGVGRHSFSEDVSSGEVVQIFQIRSTEGRGQLTITRNSDRQETKITIGGIVDRISPYIFSIRCQRNQLL